MEIILTRGELSTSFQSCDAYDVGLTYFKQNVYELFNDCDKISFKDVDDLIKILKDRNK